MIPPPPPPQEEEHTSMAKLEAMMASRMQNMAMGNDLRKYNDGITGRITKVQNTIEGLDDKVQQLGVKVNSMEGRIGDMGKWKQDLATDMQK